MKKKDLAEKASISTYTLNKLIKGQNIMTDILLSICKTLDCSFEDIMEIVDSEKYKWRNRR